MATVACVSLQILQKIYITLILCEFEFAFRVCHIVLSPAPSRQTWGQGRPKAAHRRFFLSGESPNDTYSVMYINHIQIQAQVVFSHTNHLRVPDFAR